MRFYWSLFWSYFAQYAKARLEYRWDFVAGLISDLLYQAASIIFLLVVFRQVPLLAGWRQEEVFFIYGYFLWPYSLFGMVSGGLFDFTDRYILKGEMDRLLLRPVNSLFQMLLEGFELESGMGLLTGTAIMVWAMGALGLQWRWYDPLLVLLLALGSTLVYLGVYLSFAAIGFWYDGRTGLLPLTWNITQYGKYPASIYNRTLRMMLTWVLPFAFAGYYPAAYFLRRESFLLWAVLTPAMGIGFFAISYTMWRTGMKRYQGTGS